ncbi:MAG: hypothetical protein LQ350_008397 [Teloschistes chrysophthalmus]|nr:MAG: hypothetical protein LQ350_008397 [Niorma chrysophthalma]
MANSSSPRTIETLKLAQFQGQLFRWLYSDAMTLPEITKCFNHLFNALFASRKVEINVSEKMWRARLKSWKVDWGTEDVARGEPVAMPQELRTLPQWYEGYHALEKYLPCMEKPCRGCVRLEAQDGRWKRAATSSSQGTCYQCVTCTCPAINMAAFQSASQPFPPISMTIPLQAAFAQPGAWNSSGSYDDTWSFGYSTSQCLPPLHRDDYQNPLPVNNPIVSEELVPQREDIREHPTSNGSLPSKTLTQPLATASLSRKRSRRSSPESLPDAEIFTSAEAPFEGWLDEFDQDFGSLSQDHFAASLSS